MDFQNSSENDKIAKTCMATGSACCKKGKIFLPELEYERIVSHLYERDMADELDEWKSRCEKFNGYYLYDQKDACQFLDERNLCKIHFSGIKPSECFWWPLHAFIQDDQICLKAGAYCCDGCKFVTPDSEHTKMVENQVRHIGFDLIKTFRDKFPGKEEYRFVKTIDREPENRVAGTAEFQTMRGAFRTLGAKHLPVDLLYTGEDVSIADSPSHFFAGFIQKGQLTSAADTVLVSKKEFEDFVAGKISEDELFGGDLWNDEAYIYVNTLMLEHEHHIPYIYRQLFKDMQKFCDDHETKLSHAFAIATNDKVHALLKKGNFEQIGLYREKYPIMLLDRTKNSMINSMLPNWKFNSKGLT